MTKKFTEEEYQKIVDCFDKLKAEFNLGILNMNVVANMQLKLDGVVNPFYDWPEIVAIANPITRYWAHEQFVEPEKKYYWISKKRLPTGQYKFLWKNRDGLPYGVLATTPSKPDAFTEAEVHEACYDPDMFDKEEVE